MILLVGLSELAWRMGFANSRKKSDADKASGTVRSAGTGSVGIALGFSFAIAAAWHETRRELLVEEANSIGTQRAGRSCYPNRTPLTSCGCFGNTFPFESKPIARRNFRINSQLRANGEPKFITACGLRRSPLPQNARRQSPQVS